MRRVGRGTGGQGDILPKGKQVQLKENGTAVICQLEIKSKLSTCSNVKCILSLGLMLVCLHMR